jgi:phage terminase large subunit-like protein
MEENLVRGPGDVQGEPFELDDEEIRFLLRAYEIDAHGRRVVRRGVYSRPKGRRKSEFAGALCCAEALGPVRFGGWGKGGYPVGVHVTSPFVRINATEEGQTGNTYNNCVFMLRHGPISSLPGLDVGLTRIFIPGGGEIRVSTAAASSKDGGKETFTVYDETHLYVTPELHRMYRTVQRNLAKRKIAEPWGIDTTTSYEPGQGSIAEEAHEYHKKLSLAGTTDPGFLYDHVEAPPIKDWDDDDEIRAALRYVYGPAADWIDIERIIEQEFRGETARKHEAARYFLNQVRAEQDIGLIDLDEWDAMAVTDQPAELIPDGTLVCLGLDGSRSHDHASIAHATAPDARGVVRGDVACADVNRWRLPDDIYPHVLHEGRIDYEDLGDMITERFETYQVHEAAYGGDYVEDATKHVTRRLRSAKVAPVPRSSKLERAALSALDQYLSSGKFEHRGDKVLRRAIANTLVVRDPDTKTILRIRPRKDNIPIHPVRALAFAVWRSTRTAARKKWGVAA